MSEQRRWRIAWRVIHTNAKGHGDTMFTKVEAESVCDGLIAGKTLPPMDHWIEEVRNG